MSNATGARVGVVSDGCGAFEGSQRRRELWTKRKHRRENIAMTNAKTTARVHRFMLTWVGACLRTAEDAGNYWSVEPGSPCAGHSNCNWLFPLRRRLGTWKWKICCLTVPDARCPLFTLQFVTPWLGFLDSAPTRPILHGRPNRIDAATPSAPLASAFVRSGSRSRTQRLNSTRSCVPPATSRRDDDCPPRPPGRRGKRTETQGQGIQRARHLCPHTFVSATSGESTRCFLERRGGRCLARSLWPVLFGCCSVLRGLSRSAFFRGGYVSDLLSSSRPSRPRLLPAMPISISGVGPVGLSPAELGTRSWIPAPVPPEGQLPRPSPTRSHSLSRISPSLPPAPPTPAH